MGGANLLTVLLLLLVTNRLPLPSNNKEVGPARLGSEMVEVGEVAPGAYFTIVPALKLET